MPLVNALLLAVRGAGPHPDGHGIQKQLKITVFIIPYNFCFINISKKAFLRLPLVRSQTLESEAAGPQTDGQGPFATIQG